MKFLTSRTLTLPLTRIKRPLFFSSMQDAEASGKSPLSSYVLNGDINYRQFFQKFHYFQPEALPEKPLTGKLFSFNNKPISPDNPYGQVTEGCNHRVYRARSPELGNKPYFLKVLSESRVRGQRDADEAQFITYQECFATYLMRLIFGASLIPHVVPVLDAGRWGIASSEMKYLGTLRQLSERLGYGERAIIHGASPINVINGKTYLLLGPDNPPIQIRMKQRIAFKVALRFLVAHYDVENHHNNVFIVLVEDPVNFRTVACPGMFDFGNVFDPAQMMEFVTACENEYSKAKLVSYLATNPIDAHIGELNVEDYHLITDRFMAKEAALRRVAELPWQAVQNGLDWFKKNVPAEGRQQVDRIADFIRCSQIIAQGVILEIKKIQKLEKSTQSHTTYSRGP